ncbi:MAG TPA: hypothetical protein VD770_02410, partial [Coxiellaceae bacterium]|nr:hypothetical protein [Coxiellaceae bacterium]
VFLASQSSAALGTAQLLIGHENVTRINPAVANGKFGLDSVKEIDSLKGLGVSEARKEFPHIKDFFVQKSEEFKPYHN